MAELELPNLEELEEIKAKTLTRRIALTTAIFAVLLAITSLGGNNAMKEMLLSQQQASDQWAFYQSKALREHLYKTNGLRIEMDLLERGAGMNPETKKRYETMLKNMRAEETRFGEEKKKNRRRGQTTRNGAGQEPEQGPLFRLCRGLAADIHCSGIDLDPGCLSPDILFRACFRITRHDLDAERVSIALSVAVLSLTNISRKARCTSGTPRKYQLLEIAKNHVMDTLRLRIGGDHEKITGC